MLILRKIVFYIFALFYIVFCPLVVLYAFGYIFKPQSEEVVVKTGIIYLSTAPAGASIYVNGELQNTGTWEGTFTSATDYLKIASRGTTFAGGKIDEMLEEKNKEVMET